MNATLDRTLELPVQGRNLGGPLLADSLDSNGTLIAFLRHFG